MDPKRQVASLMAFFIPFLFSIIAFALPITWSVNGHMYDVIVFPDQTWDAARTNALALGTGWDLATITSSGEQAFINSLLGTPPTDGIVQYWVGGFQPAGSPEPGGNWQWVNGEGLFWNNGAISNVYSNWGGGEPNQGGIQNHLALDNRYGWGWDDNDSFVAGVTRGYVAESVSPVPVPASILLFGIGLAGLAAAYRRRNQS